MTAIIEEITDADPTEHDDTFARILNQRNGDVEAFMKDICGFIKRRTDFFSKDGADKKVLKIIRQHQPGAGKGFKGGFLGGSAKPRVPASSTAQAAKPAEPAPKPGQPAAEPAPATDAAAPSTSAGASTSKAAEEAVEEMPSEVDEGTGLKPNAGNGLDLEKYSWTQSLAELTIVIPVPAGTRGRDCDVRIETKTLCAGVKGQDPVLKGAFESDVLADECYWNCDGKALEITLSKKDGMKWWKYPVEGEPEVNTRKVEPENSKLSDLDGETRQTVEKMMFDQRQKAMGKPTSDQLKQNEMLQQFMAAHPEMDFSQAKMM